ncbi:enoyl-CoA delta isomerase 2, peroxisomal-like [Heracleum sosnowskyi]|uniref:Enoyl-CoA delta isomerase 2, peroxisomal-like n=1 Tax=Heracleum sosnowskyi TaxID=360622 RepID=A0AAD8GVK4_9APIA|nr:enoyl-CoA delta isomerase 2, peroxisomal-like [Heracleum sosnowskyi]
MCNLEKRGSVYILTFTGNDYHRLNPSIVDSISAALHRIRSEATVTVPSSAAAFITTGESNFFSNGGDISLVDSNKDRLLLMMSKVRSVLTDLIFLSMPTIAVVNGLATGTGFMLALNYDYVFMRKDDIGFFHMGGLDSKTVIPTLFFRVKLKAKISSPAVWTDIVMKAEKMTAENAMEKGIVDAVYDTLEETVIAAVELGEQLVRRNWNGKGYVENRKFISNVVLHDQLSIVPTQGLIPNHPHQTIKGAESRL